MRNTNLAPLGQATPTWSFESQAPRSELSNVASRTLDPLSSPICKVERIDMSKVDGEARSLPWCAHFCFWVMLFAASPCAAAKQQICSALPQLHRNAFVAMVGLPVLFHGEKNSVNPMESSCCLMTLSLRAYNVVRHDLRAAQHAKP